MAAKKEDRRVQYTKIFLKEALLSLMKEKPIEKITPTELCRVADINRNTFYSHYTSPADLLSEIEQELHRDILGCVTVYSKNSLNLNGICHAIKDHAELCNVILSEHGDLNFLLNLITSARDIAFADWKKLVPTVTEAEFNQYFTYCANGSVSIIHDWISKGMEASPEEIANILEKANTAVLSVLAGEKSSC